MEALRLAVIYFFYGLSFFSRGLLVAREGGHSTDPRLRMALRPLAGFGLVHAIGEWLEMFKLAVLGAKRNGRHVGICGEAPANYPEIARYLAQLGIDSISVNPSSILRTMQVVSDAEKATTANSAPSKAKE